MSRFRTLARVATLAALVAGLAACPFDATAPGGPDPVPPRDGRDDSPVQTDSLVYHLPYVQGGYVTNVRAVYHNRTGGPVYFARCMPDSRGPMFGYRRTGPDSTRTKFSDWAWACVGGVPTGTLAAGDSLVFSVRVGSMAQPNMTPKLDPQWLVGSFRIEVELCASYTADSDFCKAVPQPARQSNAFEVRFEPGDPNRR